MTELHGDVTRKTVERFFDTLQPLEQGYELEYFSFFAVKQADSIVLIQSRLIRSTESDFSSYLFETDSVVAGRVELSAIKVSSRELISQALSGILSMPFGDLLFPIYAGELPLAEYEPFHMEGAAVYQRWDLLRLSGTPSSAYLDRSQIDWHLRAAPEPYSSLEDLLFSLKLGPLRSSVSIEVVAFAVALVDTASYVSGTSAHVSVRLANTLDPAKLRLGYRVVHQGNTSIRSSIKGDLFDWEQQYQFKGGHCTIDVPAASIVQCFSSYDGVAQHFYWIGDPSLSQNPRRATFEAFDPGLTILSEFLARQGRGQNARDLELGVSWLLWLLGFSPATLGYTARTQDFADLLVTTPDGHFLVVECTTGLLRTDNKLPQLIQRTQLVRKRIQETDNRHSKVIPVLVTSKSLDEVAADLEQAERLGVLVVTRELLEQAPQRTLTLPNADALFREADEKIQFNIAKHRPDT